jgi:hypothetical protein
MEFRFRFRTDHRLMHRIRAKVNAAQPFHAAEIGIDGDGVENAGVQQFQKHAAAPDSDAISPLASLGANPC